MNDNVTQALKAGLITLAVLLMVRSLAQQVGYGFVSGALLAESKARKDGYE
jgi:hypothetical protein